MVRRDYEKVTAYVEPELKTAFKRLAQERGTTVAALTKQAMQEYRRRAERTA